MEELIVISLNVITLAVAATVVARIKKWRKSEQANELWKNPTPDTACGISCVELRKLFNGA